MGLSVKLVTCAFPTSGGSCTLSTSSNRPFSRIQVACPQDIHSRNWRKPTVSMAYEKDLCLNCTFVRCMHSLFSAHVHVPESEMDLGPAT